MGFFLGDICPVIGFFSYASHKMIKFIKFICRKTIMMQRCISIEKGIFRAALLCILSETCGLCEMGSFNWRQWNENVSNRQPERWLW